jgi:D-arabinose 1-dehydrogenase-like Zn-dependent alcohol dehydrogenase
MLVGMPAPRHLHRVEVDGQVLITVGASVLFSYEAADSGLRHLAAVRLPEMGFTGRRVARVLGITQEYVSMLRARARAEGSAGLMRRRGRPAAWGARDLGRATATLDPGQVDVVNAVRDLTGDGAQVSIDALGSIETCQNSIRSLRKRGRHVQVGLMLAADDTPPVPMATVIAAELEIVGSHGMAAHDYPTMLAEITAGTLSPQRLVQHRIDLSEAPAKLAALDQQPGNGITIISPRRH